MTADDALKTGLFVSVLVHATLFFGWGEPVRVPSSGGTVVTMELEGGGAAISEKGGVLVEARVFDPRAADEAKAYEERRRRYLAYLQDVSNEIHARRLEAGGNGLIGICEVRFSIDEAGRFYAVRLYKSSGDPRLDRAALAAVRAASGRVKRPAGVADGPLHVSEEIRFQYDLK